MISAQSERAAQFPILEKGYVNPVRAGALPSHGLRLHNAPARAGIEIPACVPRPSAPIRWSGQASCWEPLCFPSSRRPSRFLDLHRLDGRSRDAVLHDVGCSWTGDASCWNGAMKPLSRTGAKKQPNHHRGSRRIWACSKKVDAPELTILPKHRVDSNILRPGRSHAEGCR